MTAAVDLLAHAGGRAVRAKRAFARRHFVALNRGDPAAIFVAGTARSGTTWLAEILTHGSRRRMIFEPFRNDRVPLWGHAVGRQYLRPDDPAPEFRASAQKILAGDFRNDWTDQHNARLLTSGIIIKDIAANLMLKWLQRQSPQSPFILVLRHPGAVVASWQREAYARTAREFFLDQPMLIEDHLATFHSQIVAADDQFDQRIFIWCVETLVPMRQFNRGELLIVFYEDLLLDPISELTRVSQHCGITLRRDAYRRLDSPSATTNPAAKHASSEARLHGWRNELTRAQIDRLRKIVADFGLDGIYDDAGSPRREAAERLMTASSGNWDSRTRGRVSSTCSTTPGLRRA